MKGQKTIGIIGGGQLGRMLTEAALPLGYNVVVVDPTVDCSASQVGAEQIVGDLYDESAIKQLAERSDFITIEIEHVNSKVLEAIAQQGKPVNPLPRTIHIIEDKLKQKKFLNEARIAVAPFLAIETFEDACKALKDFDGKMLLKTRNGAYDGRGNRVVTTEADIEKAFVDFKGRALYAEKFVSFQKELAIMAARSMDGDIALYPVVETVQERNICLEVLAPAELDYNVREQAEQLGRRVAELFDGAGVFGIEMFLTNTNEVLVNEIAPRVHNSGHYTIEACKTSQFEQHIRAIAGLPLDETSLIVPAAVMINVLGERNGPTQVKGVDKVHKIPYTYLHLYGKSPTKVDRKMGHITATGQILEEARMRAHKARKELDI